MKELPAILSFLLCLLPLASCGPTATARANVAGSERIGTVHLAEAIQYRPRRQF